MAFTHDSNELAVVLGKALGGRVPPDQLAQLAEVLLDYAAGIAEDHSQALDDITQRIDEAEQYATGRTPTLSHTGPGRHQAMTQRSFRTHAP